MRIKQSQSNAESNLLAQTIIKNMKQDTSNTFEAILKGSHNELCTFFQSYNSAITVAMHVDDFLIFCNKRKR